MFPCCGVQDEDSEMDSVRASPKKPLQISGPTNFRREEINIPGLDASQERWIREKALQDAKRMYSHLQPLASSPSGTFVERPASTALNQKNFPSFEQFTQPRAAPSPTGQTPRTPSGKIERVMAHGRKISENFKHSISSEHAAGAGGAGGGGPYHAVGSRDGKDEVEMRALMDPSKTAVDKTGESRRESPRLGAGVAKMSEDSFARTTTTEESVGEREVDVKSGIDAKL